MNKRWSVLRLLGIVLALGWLTHVVAWTFVTQHPVKAQTLWGIGRSLWGFLVAAGILVIAWRIGHAFQRRFRLFLTLPPDVMVLLETGVGLGVMSLFTLFLGVVGWALPQVFQVVFAVGLLFSVRPFLERKPYQVFSFPNAHCWLLAGIPIVLIALAPPEGFDALLYHLAQPEWLLAHHRLYPFGVYQFWAPGLAEGVYTWGLALHSEAAAQLMDVFYTAGAIYLAVRWAKDVFGLRTARWTLCIVISMPSLILLAPSAYTDFPLAFYAIAALYLLWHDLQQNAPEPRLRIALAMMAGLAMGTKYTALPLPVSIALILFVQQLLSRRDFRKFQWKDAWQFAAISLLVASPWYLRNWAYMGNPFYPFLFGGKFWDAFRAAWLGEPHTGIGFQIQEWLLLPWHATLGHRDAAYYHSRIGPLFWGLAPLTLASWLVSRYQTRSRRMAKVVWGGFVLVSIILWSLGVMQSRGLWQTRLLLPALVVLAIPTAYGIHWSRRLNIPDVLRVRYLFQWGVLLVAGVALLEMWSFTAFRHPTTYIFGLESRETYYQRALTDYADLSRLIQEHTEPDARVFFLFEPRSYGLHREILPDAILDHWAWYLHRLHTPEAVKRGLQCEGYTHVLVYRWGMDFLIENHPEQMTPQRTADLRAFLNMLPPVASEGHYSLYALPAASCEAP